MLEAFTAAIGFASLGGSIIFFLIKYNYKQANELAKTKDQLFNKKIETLKVTTEEHAKHLARVSNELSDFTTEIKRVAGNNDVLRTKIETYVESTEKRLKFFETKIIQLSKEVNDLILVKGSTKKEKT